MEEWKCATVVHGAPCVMTRGITQMLSLPADSLDMQVKNHAHCVICKYVIIQCNCINIYSSAYSSYLKH